MRHVAQYKFPIKIGLLQEKLSETRHYISTTYCPNKIMLQVQSHFYL